MMAGWLSSLLCAIARLRTLGGSQHCSDELTRSVERLTQDTWQMLPDEQSEPSQQ